MATNHNIAPYFDDFDASKNYHKILFRPGFAVQARELTQIQSILKDQIEQFGNHIFKQGSIVIPGNSRSDLSVPYIKVNSSFLGTPITISQFENAIVRGETTGVLAVVRKIVSATSTDPITMYLSYISGGVINDEPTGKLQFEPDENIVIDSTNIKCKIQPESTAVGIGSLAFVNKGVYYVNGTFVHIDSQSVVIDKYASSPSCHVLLKINETIIDSTEDETLLDPAQGSYNFAAPGADRYRLSLELVTLPIDATITDDYVEIMRFRSGVLEEHARTPKYNELEKSLARRTFDESGDYVVSGLRGKITEHKKESTNGGLYLDGDFNKFAVTVSPGKAYIKGFEVEKISNTVFSLDKARTNEHVLTTSTSLPIDFGKFIYVTNIKGDLKIATKGLFNIINADPSNSAPTTIGTGRVLAIDYHAGTPTSPYAIYKLYYSELNLNVTKLITEAGGIQFVFGGEATVVHAFDINLGGNSLSNPDVISAASGERVAKVAFWQPEQSTLFVYKHDKTKLIPKVGDLINNSTTSGIVRGITSVSSSLNTTTGLIFPISQSVVKSIKNGSTFNHTYSVQKNITITTDSSGTGSVSISDGIFRPIEVGTFIANTATGIASNTLFSINTAGNQLSIAGGTANATYNVYATVDKTAFSPRTKTLSTRTQSFSPSVGQTVFSADKPDVYAITSITQDGVDIASDFLLSTGQTDNTYENGSFILKSSKTISTSQITITYTYFEHSSGDFFCVDSYSANSNADDLLLEYKASNGQILDLRSCLDFRSTKTGLTTYSTNETILTNSRFTSALQVYLGRVDVLVVGKSGNVDIIKGTPSTSPKANIVPSDMLAIEEYSIPAYTRRITDITTKKYQVERYTMADITKLANRVKSLEEFSLLSAAENNLINYDVIDASTGLPRFKTGYFVESFDDPIKMANVTDKQFAVTFERGYVTTAIDQMQCPATVITSLSSSYTNTNGLITLPFTEKVFAKQSVSSRVTNLNPFLVIKWDGKLTVTPNSDSWIDVIDLPEIFDQRTETVVVTRWVPAPVDANSQNSNTNRTRGGGNWNGSFGTGNTGTVGGWGSGGADGNGGTGTSFA